MKLAVLIAAQLTAGFALSTNFLQDNTLEHDLALIEEIPVSTTIVHVDVPIPTGVDAFGDVKQAFPVPTASRCVVIMTVAYMAILAALAITRAYHDIFETARGRVEAALKAAFQTMTYGPMVCVLFIAYRMRVEFLSYGIGQPQMWAQHCMYGVTFAVIASAVSVLLIPLVTGKPLPLKEDSHELAPVSEDEHKYTKIALSTLRYLILLGLYGGLAGVLVGMLTYMPPHEDNFSKLPSPAPAVLCTMIIAVIFFAIQLIIAICRAITEFSGFETAAIVSIMNGAANTIELGPMLCILFLAARMRALQHDGQPQEWAQQCMFASTGALALTTLLAIAVPIVHAGKLSVDDNTHEFKFQARNRIIGIVMIVIRYATMFLFYGGAVAVAVSILLFKAPKGETLPLSPTVQCVMILTAQFFILYVMQVLMMTVSELSQGKYPMETYSFFGALDAAKTTVQFAPMLAILFVTTRMYALLITDKKGAPQHWVQDCMYLATWSLLISALTCVVTGIAKGKVEQDEDGNVTNKFENKALGVSMINLRALCLFMFYGGSLGIIAGLFVMTPETANGHGGRIPVISEAVDLAKGKGFLF